MKLFSVAIGEQYEVEALRLKRTIGANIEVLTKSDSRYTEVSADELINALWHKANFANFIVKADGAVIFMDADMFTLVEDPFATFKVNENTDIAYVPYEGKWFLPDLKRQEAFNFHGHKINSGFIYFRNLEIAQTVCSQWQHEYLEREKLYNVAKGTSKYEYDEWALMIALMGMNYKIELLDSKWNTWELKTEEEILASNAIFLQSHSFLDIEDLKQKKVAQ